MQLFWISGLEGTPQIFSLANYKSIGRLKSFAQVQDLIQ